MRLSENRLRADENRRLGARAGHGAAVGTQPLPLPYLGAARGRALCRRLRGVYFQPELGGLCGEIGIEQFERSRAFLLGTLSGSVEPLFGMLVVLAASGVRPLMPWLLSFAAGAMLYVVVEELVPQAHSKAGTCGFVSGFLIMMILDVALG